MTTMDTNVVVRFLVGDDAEQAKQARALFADASRDLVVLNTVLLETEWVLRAAYGFDRAAVVTALRGVLGLPNVRAEDPDRAHRALAWHSTGLDFADALHLAGSREAQSFKTFDRAFVRDAPTSNSCPVELL